MNSDGSIEIVLERPDSYVSWGFRLSGGKGATQPLNIQLVYDGTPAEEAGLEIGDRIHKIGGQNAADLSLFEAKRLVSQQGDRLCLHVKRRRGSAPFPMAAVTKTPKPPTVKSDDLVVTAKPTRADDADQDVPPPTPPSPATAANAQWSDRNDLPSYQRNQGKKAEPWRPPPEPSEPKRVEKPREFRHSVPATKPQVTQVVSAVAVPSAEAQVSEETVPVNRPQTSVTKVIYQPDLQGSNRNDGEEDNQDRTKLPAYQRNLLNSPGSSPSLSRRETPSKPINPPKNETNSLSTNLSEPISSSPNYQRSVYRVSPASTLTRNQTDINEEMNSLALNQNDNVLSDEMRSLPAYQRDILLRPASTLNRKIASPVTETSRRPEEQPTWQPQPSQGGYRNSSPVHTSRRPEEQPTWQPQPSQYDYRNSSPVQTSKRPDEQPTWQPQPSQYDYRNSSPVQTSRRPEEQPTWQPQPSQYDYRNSSPVHTSKRPEEQPTWQPQPSQYDYRNSSPVQTSTRSEEQPTWQPPVQPQQESFSIDYSKMASFPAYQRVEKGDSNSRQSPNQVRSSTPTKQDDSGYPSQRQRNDDSQGNSTTFPAYQSDIINRSSPSSTLTRRMEPGLSGSESPDQSRRVTLPAYQRDLMNRASPVSSRTTRGDSPGRGSPRWNSPGQPRKNISIDDNQKSATLPYQIELTSRVQQSASLPRYSGGVDIQGWNSPTDSRQYENDEEAQLASLPPYQRDLLNHGSPASTLTRVPPQSQRYSTSETPFQPSVLPAYQRDLMNNLPASSMEPMNVKPQSAVEQDWYEPDRRFSVPAYQRDHVTMGSHFDKAASLGRRLGSGSEAPSSESSDPPPRPLLARTYTPSEVINCDICKKNVVGPFVRILSKYRMHPECVRCCVCGTILMDTTRVMMEDKLFCEPHALEFAQPPGEDMVPVIVYPNAK